MTMNKKINDCISSALVCALKLSIDDEKYRKNWPEHWQSMSGWSGVTESPEEVRMTIESITAFSEKTEVDGKILDAVKIDWFDIVYKHLCCLRKFVDNKDSKKDIDPYPFEALIAAAFRKSDDYEDVILTPLSGDGGVDVLLRKIGEENYCDFVQVKRYSPGKKNKVTYEEVMSTIGVLLLNKYRKAYIVTTSTFAPGVDSDEKISKLIEEDKLELIPGSELNNKLYKLFKW